MAVSCRTTGAVPPVHSARARLRRLGGAVLGPPAEAVLGGRPPEPLACLPPSPLPSCPPTLPQLLSLVSALKRSAR